MTDNQTKFSRSASGWKETELGLIPEDWKLDLLGNRADVIMGQSPESKYYNYNGDGALFMQGVRTFGEKYPTFDTWTTRSTKTASAGSILVSVRAPVGDLNLTPVETCIGRGLAAVNAKNGNNEFIYQLLKAYSKKIVSQETGTVYGSISRDDLNNLELPFPNDDEQQKIAGVLGALDEKIELNQKMNKTLEQIAQAIFEKWQGKVVDSKKINEFGRIVCGKTPSKSNAEYFGGKVPFIKIPDMHNQTFIVKTEDSLTAEGQKSQSNKTIPASSVCVSCIATVGLVSITSDESQTNQQINSIIPSKPEYVFYLYLILKSLKQDLKDMASGGSATLNMNTGTFSNIEVNSLAEEDFVRFDHEVRPIFEIILLNIKEIETLLQIRDSLLPRLMSGKLRVK